MVTCGALVIVPHLPMPRKVVKEVFNRDPREVHLEEFPLKAFLELPYVFGGCLEALSHNLLILQVSLHLW